MKRGFHTLSDLPGTLPIFPLTGVLLLPHSALPLNVFEPRYLALVDDALSGNRLIGMIQPTESEEDVLKPRLSEVGCAGRLVSYRETEDNRYLITLAGVCRFKVKEEVPVLSPYRQVACDFRTFRFFRSGAERGRRVSPRAAAVALKHYLSPPRHEGRLKSVMTAPPEIPGQRAGDDVPLRAGGKAGPSGSAELGRACRHAGGAAGDFHGAGPRLPQLARKRVAMTTDPKCWKSWSAR